MTLSKLFTVKEFTGKHMLVGMLMFFGVIITANMTMAWFAVSTWSGLVAKNGYVESINFKAKQEAVDRQTLLGWKSKVRLINGQVIFSVKDVGGKPVSDLSIVATIGRPTTEKADAVMAFRQANPGEYLAGAPEQSGQWILEIQATGVEKQLYRKKYRILVGAN
ncbi:hypothetical protein MNBD_ALPHA08-578 [hydrothermal vent metagenome]|uniref:Type cbb3 cytochrome oxidase biogenesis protein CcoH n=1 Tax=hydrothermal vent metagenome TaxID=652676 RepID=A0A3B0RMR7_9ZZZZ